MTIAESGLPLGGNGNGNGNGVGKMTLVEAAHLVERLQGRAAHERELEALRIARDALLVVVSEGFSTLGERLRSDVVPGSSIASFRGATAPPR